MSRPNYETVPTGKGSTIRVPAHEFQPDSLGGWGGPDRLQDIIVTAQMARRGLAPADDEDAWQDRWPGLTPVAVPEEDLRATLDRLARAEQTVPDKLARLHDRGEGLGLNSPSWEDLAREIEDLQDAALEHCYASSEAAGVPWTASGLKHVTAQFIIRYLVAEGWLPARPPIEQEGPEA